MHLLAVKPGAVSDGSEPVDLGQSPGEIVFLSAADTERAAIARAHHAAGEGAPSLRLANPMQLGHPMSVDAYVEDVIAGARLVVARLLGGASYWRYGVEQVVETCRRRRIPLALLPGDDKPDEELARLSTVDSAAYDRLWAYCVQGGPDNAAQLVAYASTLVGYEADWREPRPLLKAGLYWPGLEGPDLDAVRRHWAEGAPVVPIVFYRALLQGGSLAPVDALVEGLAAEGLAPLPIYATSLKDPVAADTIRGLLDRAPPAVILNATGFAVSTPGAGRAETPFDGADRPILQVVFAGDTEADWRAGTRGLNARDLAMNVALPEVDGRVLARAVSFKTDAEWDPRTESALVTYRPVADRVAFVARLAAAWARLAGAPAAERRVAIVLANYPNRDGRLGNGVGLDTPASAVTVLEALAEAGYSVADIPADGDALMRRLLAGPTNALAGRAARQGGQRLDLAAYRAWFATQPDAVRTAVLDRWGDPADDPFVEDGAFRLAILSFGAVTLGIQPARGYNIDPKATYHDPDLVPPHGYLAFYAWLRTVEDVHAVVHAGKHGNLEWLPGKALALSGDCFPEAAFGPVPQLYPFIVNDPGEGTQAKRRTSAVVIDHLTPPLTRAESYGPLKDLEALVDEYYDAAGVDPRRLRYLSERILDLARRIGLDADCGIADEDDEDEALTKLDNHLCELKEMQIRDGLHIFGRAPEAERRADLLVALTRVPRGDGKDADASLIRALAGDLGLSEGEGGFDPLDCAMAEPWAGPRPEALARVGAGAWRTAGDTVERLEGLARALVDGVAAADPGWRATNAVLATIDTALRPMLERVGAAELDGLLRGLDGRFVEPGAAGAPTRGRLDTLPTGRNFFSVDSRVVPTPAAWHLGWKSASLLLDRHRQEHGEWPRSLALTAWGTANMRTGGDDIAQALALMGVRPTWDTASRRVTGFEILPESVLGRPRVDVTLRVSGFFRDAFPSQIALVDSAARAIAALDEPGEVNPAAASVAAERARLEGEGVDPETAATRAGYRVFGSKPGAYGAGLQALVDERLWQERADFGEAYVAWGGWAYGAAGEGEAAHDAFERRLAGVEAVVHNQDNREHDLLDSDDYYQFEGGMTAAVEALSGARPTVYHTDHSRPERPVIRTLEEEVARVVRGRAVNPKWIAGVMRHGYKGAFEIAATVDYLFAFAATTGAVRDHHFDAVFDAYVADDAVRGFLAEHNPDAAREIAERLIEALDRGLWQPRANAAHAELTAMAGREESP
ncbi:MAG: cobaltochelatase subunit CobN [Azospirillaceae bacterium]